MTTIFTLQRYDGKRVVKAYFDPSEGAFVVWPAEDDRRRKLIPPWEVSGARWTVTDTEPLEEFVGADS